MSPQCLLLYYIHHLLLVCTVRMLSLSSHTFPFPFCQILKLYAWEPSFQVQVENVRGQELKVMKKFAYLTSVSTFIFSSAPALVSAVKESHT